MLPGYKQGLCDKADNAQAMMSNFVSAKVATTDDRLRHRPDLTYAHPAATNSDKHGN